MRPQEKKKSLSWIQWFLFSEGLMLLLALAGPGFRNTDQRPDPFKLLARLFFEEPSYLQAVIVNFAAVHLVVGGALLAAWLSARLRK